VRNVGYMVAPAPAPRRSLARVLPPRPALSAVIMIAFTAALYLSEALDQFTPLYLDDDGIIPRTLSGLEGILWAPLLHGGWAHLFANTIPFLVFGFLAMAGGIRQWVMVTAAIWVVGGLGVWLLGPAGVSTIGASGVIFGWLAFLLVRGLFARSGRQILVALVLLFFWGGVLWGVLPGQEGISWQGHLFGAAAGILAAWLVARADRRRRGREAPAPPVPGLV
jgi:membrane associated rhomboid family serine protease